MKELLKSLNNNRDNLASFLSIIEKQRDSLVNNDLNSLEESILNEEKVLNTISDHQKKTSEILKQLAEEYKLGLTDPEQLRGDALLKLNDFISASEKKNIKVPNEILILRASIKELIAKIILAMKKNKILIDHSRNFIKETIAALNNSEKPVLDRKV